LFFLHRIKQVILQAPQYRLTEVQPKQYFNFELFGVQRKNKLFRYKKFFEVF
jgi:hypothetical protein